MKSEKLIMSMMEYYAGDPKRIQHFIKVHSLARVIGLGEHLDAEAMEIIEAAAIVHDIGIKLSEELYGDSIGKHQEELGPGAAETMLRRMGCSDELVHRVSYLVGHHHTYTDIDGIDYRILVESDFLVNIYEDGLSKEAARAAYDNIFRTETGRKLFRDMYPL